MIRERPRSSDPEKIKTLSECWRTAACQDGLRRGAGIAAGEECHNGAWIPLLFAAVPYGAEFAIGGARPRAPGSPPRMPIELKQSLCGASVSKP